VLALNLAAMMARGCDPRDLVAPQKPVFGFNEWIDG
jgi:type IV pilus biogenesis protein CpaD/CtpE